MAGSWLLPAGSLVATFCLIYRLGRRRLIRLWNVYNNRRHTGLQSLPVLFPKLSRRSAEGDTEGFGSSVSLGLLTLWALTLPFIFGAFILSREGVAALLMRGAFGPSDADTVSSALRMLLFAVPAFAVNEMLSRVFYSRSEPAISMYAAVAGIGVMSFVALFR